MRFSRIHVLVIGLIVIGALLVAFVFAFVQPQRAKLSDIEDEVGRQQQVADGLLTKLKGLADAQIDLERKEKQTYAYMARMPEISTDQYQAMIDLWKEYASVAGPFMQHYITRRPGITLTAFSIPSAPVTPLQPVHIILVPVQDFAVRAANLPAIIQFLRDISKAPRMATIADVEISGTSPFLAVQMPLRMYLVTRWALPGPGQAPRIAAPAAGRRPAGRPLDEEGDDDDDDDE